MHAVLVDELASRLGRDAGAFRGVADVDIHAMSSTQAELWSRGQILASRQGAVLPLPCSVEVDEHQVIAIAVVDT
jgi:hypothetical protein